MKTIHEIIELEKYIFQHHKSGTPLETTVAAFNALPKYPEPKPLVADLTDTSYQYCEAIRRYCLGEDHPDFIDERTMWSIMDAKRIVVPWGHAPAGWPSN